MAKSDPFSTPAPARPRFYKSLLLGVTAIGVFFGGFGAWAYVAPLSRAAVAPGQVRVESHRKTIQHLEGGIIRDILVKEGDVVEKGQVLIRLDDLQADMASEILIGQHAALQAQAARLVAERDGLAKVEFPQELLDKQDEPSIKLILDGQNRIFASRKVSLQGQLNVLDQRVLQLQSEADAYAAQLKAAEDQARFIAEELETVKDLTTRGYERKSRVLALEREHAELMGKRGEQLGMIARTGRLAGEAKLQMVDLRNTKTAEIDAELRDVEGKLSELDDHMRAARDVKQRTEIVAPQAGRVVQMRHVTPGGVVRPGDPLLDLVPIDDIMVIDARISPMDIDAVHAGLDAEVRLSGLNYRTLPILMGKVITVSADAFNDERTGTSYYIAEVSFPVEQLKSLTQKVQLYPGMPADVMVVTGQRTPLEYFVDPVRESFQKAFREE